MVELNGNGKQVGSNVHQLIALTFLGPCPDGLQVCHNNGDRTDNRVENLRYDTPSENIWDARRHGTWSAGAKHYKYRVDIDEAAVLRLRADGWSYQRLAQEFGIGEATVGRILKGERLRAIPKEKAGPVHGRLGPGPALKEETWIRS